MYMDSNTRHRACLVSSALSSVVCGIRGWTHSRVFETKCWHSVPVKQKCKRLDIQFHLLHGSAGEVLPGFVSDHNLGAVVTDFSPLREPLQWLEDLKKKLPKDIPLIQVKTLSFHLNIFVWMTSFISLFIHCPHHFHNELNIKRTQFSFKTYRLYVCPNEHSLLLIGHMNLTPHFLS